MSEAFIPQTGGRRSDRVGSHGLVAVCITALLSVAFALLMHDVVRNFFPYAEEWKILLPSVPWLSHPLDWFRGFADTMSDPYPAWSVPAINFLRPVMNLLYWARAVTFGDNWGAYLYFNFPLVASAAGALYFGLRAQAGAAAGFWLALLLVATFVAMPPMVSAASYFLPIMIPQMPVDGLIAALYVLACVAFIYRRYAITSLLVILALLTKEQAVTIAAAVPAVYAWQQRRDLRHAWPSLLLLAAPLALWVAVRLMLFGSVSGGVYVMLREPLDIVRETVSGLLRLPFYAPSPTVLLRDPVSLPALLLLCNLTVLAYLALDICKRWWRQGPDVVSVTVVFTWGFLALVGLNPRYGGILIAPVIWMIARPAVGPMLHLLRGIALGAVVVAGLVHGAMSVPAFSTHVGMSKSIYEVGRAYAAALEEETEATLIVVLNDPNTQWTAPSDMARVLRLPVTDVVKASDYPWRWPSAFAKEIPDQHCEVAVLRLDAQLIEMQQSCDFLIMGAEVPRETPLRLPLAQGVEAVFPEPGFEIANRGTQVGRTLRLHVERPDVAVLYFDPEARSFHWVEP